MSPKKPTILIADDDTSIRDILSNILNFKGYRTLEAADGKEALERIENEDINLVLLDLKLPRVDGLDVLKKTLELKPNLP
ncbi:MAG TPA: response regulator, partial [Bacteroidetes bacterium]|nr:response regulator [Bacteroidota bacterium]